MKDPKEIVTPYAFEVESTLLGKPLATPKRRFLALVIDLLIAAILMKLGGIILGFITAIIFFVAFLRYQKAYPFKRGIQIGIAVIGATSIFILCLVMLGKNYLPKEIDPDIAHVNENISGAEISEIFLSALNGNASDSVQEKQSLEEFAKNLEKQIREKISNSKVQERDLPPNADQLVMAYAKAYKRRDSIGIDTLQNSVQEIVAGKQLNQLENKNERYQEVIELMEDENDDLRDIAENPGFLRTLKATANDFGLVIGWTGIYFVFFIAFWDGQTPGKRLLKLQVVRLNGDALNLWNSFERFGGYSAGLATGLLGFLQVYWDSNRQGIHDKIAGTVVLDHSKHKEVHSKNKKS